MPKLIQTNETDVGLWLIPRDANGDTIGEVPYNDPLLAVRWRHVDSAGWNSIPLVSGGPTYFPGGWQYLGGGVHQLWLPDAAIHRGGSSLIELAYGANPPQFDTVDAVIPPPAGDGVIVAIPRMVATQLNPGQASFSMQQLVQRNATQVRLFRGTRWALVIEDVGEIDETSSIYFTLKAGELAGTPDTAAMVQIVQPISGGGASGLIRLDGVPAANAADGSIAYQSYTVNGIERQRVLIILEDRASAAIWPGSYNYDIKHVGTESPGTTVLDYGRLEVMAEVTNAVSG